MIVFCQLVQRPVTKRIDVTVIVREQHIMLEMLNGRTAIMLQPLQREIDSLRVEQCQWMGFIGLV